MPVGVTLLSWKAMHHPVAIETCAIVNDVQQFISTTLEQLRAAIVGQNWLAGNWSARELTERLEQVGVTVEINTDCPGRREPQSILHERPERCSVETGVEETYEYLF